MAAGEEQYPSDRDALGKVTETVVHCGSPFDRADEAGLVSRSEDQASRAGRDGAVNRL
jgi:hypothetical protein